MLYISESYFSPLKANVGRDVRQLRHNQSNGRGNLANVLEISILVCNKIETDITYVILTVDIWLVFYWIFTDDDFQNLDFCLVTLLCNHY